MCFLPKAKGYCPPRDASIWVVGRFREQTGLGEGARLYLRELLDAGESAFGIDISASTACDADLPERVYLPASCPAGKKPGIFVIHDNPPLFLLSLARCRHLLKEKRIVGLWLWELEEIPPHWAPCFRFVDAVQCPSEFVAEAVRRRTLKEVTVHPYPVTPQPVRKRRLAEDGVIRVLSIFAFASNFYRKNSLAVIEAFRQAFGSGTDAELILKTDSAERFPREWRLFQDALAGADNIRVLSDPLNREEMQQLYSESDVYLSLHRSEGYGLTIRDAMSAGLEVVATGWSGNMEFMTGPKCHPVPFRLIDVEDPTGVYVWRGSRRWAEPDVEAAAAILRRIAGRED